MWMPPGVIAVRQQRAFVGGHFLFQGADLHAAILAGDACDDFLAGGVELLLGLGAVGACLATEDADSTTDIRRGDVLQVIRRIERRGARKVRT